MRPAIGDYNDHFSDTFEFGSEPDTVGAFQIYRSQEDADAFLRTPACADQNVTRRMIRFLCDSEGAQFNALLAENLGKRRVADLCWRMSRSIPPA